MQLEGLADEPSGEALARLKSHYFAQFPDGGARQEWPGITCVRVHATWVRFSDYSVDPPVIVELRAAALFA